jgi:hypothetical protein
MLVSPTGLGRGTAAVAYIRTMNAGVQLRKRYSGRESQGARGQDELIGGKPSVVK